MRVVAKVRVVVVEEKEKRGREKRGKEVLERRVERGRREEKVRVCGLRLWIYYFFIRRRKRSSGETTARAASPLERSFGALER